MSDMNPEELFPPRKGGMVEQARKQAADEQAQAASIAGDLAAEAEARFSVPVNDNGGDLARARTHVVSTSGVAVTQLLGRDDQRRNAVIMTLDEPVVISFSLAAADDPVNQVNAAGLQANGFVLPVNVPLPVNTKAEIWCTATSSTATRVSVAAFSYAEG